MKLRRPTIAAPAVACALALAACGGGGAGGDNDADDPVAAVPPAQGVGQAASSSGAVAELGGAAAEEAEDLGGTLSSYETLGGPGDAFRQQVRPDGGEGGSGSEPSAGGAPAGAGGPPTVVPDVPEIDDTPLVAVPGDGGATLQPPPSVPVAPTAPTAPPSASPAPSPPADSGAEAGSGDAPPPAEDAPPPAPARAMEADFDVSGEPVVAREGDAIPPGTQQFVVEVVGEKEVLLRLNGGLLPDGGDTVKLAEGESVTLYNATADRNYRIKLVDLRVARG